MLFKDQGLLLFPYHLAQMTHKDPLTRILQNNEAKAPHKEPQGTPKEWYRDTARQLKGYPRATPRAGTLAGVAWRIRAGDSWVLFCLVYHTPSPGIWRIRNQIGFPKQAKAGCHNRTRP